MAKQAISVPNLATIEAPRLDCMIHCRQVTYMYVGPCLGTHEACDSWYGEGTGGAEKVDSTLIKRDWSS
jgi:hypothetical protein